MANNKECDDPSGKRNIVYEKKEGLQTAEQCGDVCSRKSSMFSFGRKCLCEVSASEEGTCNQVNNNGYNLYRFDGTN